ncbi:MAG TPA: MauE/DoxX family redox-associated membrane protein, partial [Acidimicrobiia bacterium]|nr:MauE/DoxX family redox-associated membrane protein [Acidimicrobiia bacterium]
MVAQGITTIALALLAASGVSKALDPDPTRGALKAAHLPSSRAAVVALGLIEVVAAMAGIVAGGRWLALAGALYLGFSVFTFAALRGRIPVQSCGCFGR